MRTTVEMKPEHRAELMRLAANRNEKGFSGVLAEAIEQYLKGEEKRLQEKKQLQELYGSITDEEAAEMRAEIAKLRSNWR